MLIRNTTIAGLGLLLAAPSGFAAETPATKRNTLLRTNDGVSDQDV